MKMVENTSFFRPLAVLLITADEQKRLVFYPCPYLFRAVIFANSDPEGI